MQDYGRTHKNWSSSSKYARRTYIVPRSENKYNYYIVAIVCISFSNSSIQFIFHFGTFPFQIFVLFFVLFRVCAIFKFLLHFVFRSAFQSISVFIPFCVPFRVRICFNICSILWTIRYSNLFRFLLNSFSVPGFSNEPTHRLSIVRTMLTIIVLLTPTVCQPYNQKKTLF